MSISSNFIESSGERFIKSDYNGISILIREKDGFINATKIAKDNGKQKHLNKYFKSKKWSEICEKFKEIALLQKRGNGNNSENNNENLNLPQKWRGSENTEILTNYVINSVGNCEIYGTYVHPDLVHFVTEWCNIEYAFKVNIIMNNINKLKELEHKDGNEFLETITKRLKNKIKDLEEEITSMSSEQNEAPTDIEQSEEDNPFGGDEVINLNKSLECKGEEIKYIHFSELYFKYSYENIMDSIINTQ